jgi:hypothetical protein
MLLSVITAPIVLAELIDILIRRSYVNPPMFEYSSCKFDPPHLFKIWIRLRQYIGAVMVSSYWPKFPALRLFVEIMPIYNAVATGTEILSFTEKRHVQIAKNFRWPQCHNARQNLNYCVLPHPPNFSLPSTFKKQSFARYVFIYLSYKLFRMRNKDFENIVLEK